MLVSERVIARPRCATFRARSTGPQRAPLPACRGVRAVMTRAGRVNEPPLACPRGRSIGKYT
jgi:hypothetical protein